MSLSVTLSEKAGMKHLWAAPSADQRTTFSRFLSPFSKFSAALTIFCNPDGAQVKYLKAGFTGNSKAGLVVRVGLNLLPLTGTSTPQHLICSLSSHGSVLPRHTLYSGGDKAEVRPRVEQNFGDRSSWTVTPPAWPDLL